MPDEILDTGIRDLFDSRKTGGLQDRVIRTIQHEQGLDFMHALERMQQAAESAVSSGDPTLRGVLRWSTADDGDRAARTLKLLDRRDAVVEAAGRRAQETVTRHLDRAVGERVDPAVALTDPAEAERRLLRARRLDRSYDGEAGRRRFMHEDRIQLEAGTDYVHELELRFLDSDESQRTIRAAREQASGHVAKLLDAAISDAAGQRDRLKQLEAELEEASGQAAGPLKLLAARARGYAEAADDDAIRMLDQMTGIETGYPTASVSWDAVQERMRLLGRPQNQFLMTLDEIVAGKPLPLEVIEEANATVKELEQAGIHPGAHAVHERIQERMKELDRGPDQYIQTMEEVLAEGVPEGVPPELDPPGGTMLDAPRMLDIGLAGDASPAAVTILNAVRRRNRITNRGEFLRLLDADSSRETHPVAWAEACQFVRSARQEEVSGS